VCCGMASNPARSRRTTRVPSSRLNCQPMPVSAALIRR
jgi:hypothetical protein